MLHSPGLKLQGLGLVTSLLWLSLFFIYKMMGIETMISKVMSRSDNLRNLVVRIELNVRIKMTAS